MKYLVQWFFWLQYCYNTAAVSRDAVFRVKCRSTTDHANPKPQLPARALIKCTVSSTLVPRELLYSTIWKIETSYLWERIPTPALNLKVHLLSFIHFFRWHKCIFRGKDATEMWRLRELTQRMKRQRWIGRETNGGQGDRASESSLLPLIIKKYSRPKDEILAPLHVSENQ